MNAVEFAAARRRSEYGADLILSSLKGLDTENCRTVQGYTRSLRLVAAQAKLILANAEEMLASLEPEVEDASED